jgi:hemerythrin-like domain-containing protein
MRDLFAGFDPEMDITATMCREHDQARHLVRELVRGIEAADITLVATCLTAHRELLRAHIKKEDEILYPWIDRGLSDAQVGRLFSGFREVDREFAGEPARQEEFVHRAELTLHAQAG